MKTFRVLIEISKGTLNNKYEYDEATKAFKLGFVFKNVVWPYNYGFFPNTLGGDGDALDAIILSSAPIEQGEEVEVKIIGMLDVLDRGEQDYKIICVPVNDQMAKKYDDIIHLPEIWLKEWENFFLELARQKKKVTEVRGVRNKLEAQELITTSKTD